MFYLRGIRTGALTLLCATELLASMAAVSAARAAEQLVPAVVVAPVAKSDLRATAVFSGRAVAIQKTDIRARVTGFLETVAFTGGDLVSKGDALYAIECDAYGAAVAEIRGVIVGAGAARDLAVIERDRLTRLVTKQAAAQRQLDIAKAKLVKAKGEIMRLEARLGRAELDVSYCQIVAPFDGTIALTAVHVGALIGPDSGVLTTLTRLDPMNVKFPVATAELVRLRERRLREGGDRARTGTVTLILANGSPYPHEGAIDFVGAEVARGTDTVTVRARFPNPDNLLLDGALVSTTLEQSKEALVLSVPQRAIQRDQLGTFVMVVDAGGKVELRRVTVERVTRGRSVISEGLKESELVITDGLNKVRPGITVDAATASGG